MCLAVASTSSAQSFTYELDGEPIFTIEYPIGWTILTEKDEDLLERPEGVPPMPLLVTARPKSGLLWFGTWVMRKLDTFDDAKEYLSSLVGHLFKAETVNRLEEGVHNGMTFRYYYGYSGVHQKESQRAHKLSRTVSSPERIRRSIVEADSLRLFCIHS